MFKQMFFFLYILRAASPLLLGGRYCGICFYTKENIRGLSCKPNRSGILLSVRQLKKPQLCITSCVYYQHGQSLVTVICYITQS